MTDKEAFKIVLVMAKSTATGKSKKGKQAIGVVEEYLRPHAWWWAISREELERNIKARKKD